MDDFVSEDDLHTFEGWLRFQAVDPSGVSPSELSQLREAFDEATARDARSAKVGLMKLQPVLGEFRYAVAVREGTDLWLVLWIRRSRKGEFFIMMPRGDREWDPHASYHLDGRFHQKSYGQKMAVQQRQALASFRGVEHLGTYMGFAAKTVGAACDPAAFSGITEVSAVSRS